MSKKIEFPDKQELAEYYAKPNVSISELARYYNTSNPTVRKWLKHYQIPLKKHSDICRILNREKTAKKPPYTVLKQTYDKHSIKQMETIFQCGQQTIYGWLDEYQIPRRNVSEGVRLGKEKQYADIQFSKQEIEKVYSKTKHLALAADELGISQSHLRTLKSKYGIKTLIPWRSKQEVELFEFLRQYDPDCLSNNKSIIAPYELDIVSERYQIAIEYCGLYWHSEYYGGKNKEYHRKKYLMCKEKGYTLITVFESDDIEKVKRLLTFKMTKRTIGARKTKVVELQPSDAKSFHQKYHLHNSIGGSYHYGLVYEDDLVMVGTFHKARFNQKYQYECGRLTAGDIRVIGGVSKLFHYFISTVKPKSLITYSDLRFGDGSCYQHCNLEQMNDTPPNYWYFSKNNPSALYSRVSFQKHKLNDKLDSFDKTLTEFQNMINNKWDRVWDCGNAVYTYNG